MAVDHYAELEISRGASIAAVKAAFRRAALRTHPDVAEGGRAAFLRASAAYAVLGNAAARAEYDSANPLAGLAADDSQSSPFGFGGGSGAFLRGSGKSGSAGWARSRAGTAARGAPQPPDESGPFTGSNFYDHDEHRRAHYGLSPAERAAWIRSNMRNGGSNSAQSTWAYRRTMRERAAAWERDAAMSVGGSVNAGAGESEGAYYRRFAAAFRERQAASAARWPRRLVAWAAATAALLALASTATKRR